MQRVMILALVLWAVLTTSVAANDGITWIGLGAGSSFGAEFHHALGPFGFLTQGGSLEHPSPDPAVSETSIRESQGLSAVFYEYEFGGISAGIGAAHFARSQVGTKTIVVDGDSVAMPVKVLSETSTSLAGIGRAKLGQEPIIGDVQALVTSEGVLWSVRAGYQIEHLRVGVGYQAGPTDDWWSGPLIFAGIVW